MDKKVLIITYYWPPSGGSGVQRWVKFSKYLPQNGWCPVIYTPENPDLIARDESLQDDVPECVEVIRRPMIEPYGIYRRLLGRKNRVKDGRDVQKASDTPTGQVNPINAQKKTTRERMMMWIRGNLFIPDPRCWWIRPSVKFLTKYLKENHIDAIVTTGPPHSMHLIGRELAQKTGIPWVADFRDPWTEMFYFKHLNLGRRALKRHKKLEKAVLSQANAVVAVSPLVQEDFQRMCSNRIELITNGFDEDDFVGISAQADGNFNLVHTGLFASDGNPTMLWKVLSEKCAEDSEFAKCLRIRIAGKTDREIIEAIKVAGLGENLVDLGYLQHADAVKQQKGADVLLLPLRKEPEYRATLPGKLFEYLAARRPVLGIGQSDGAMARILDEVQAGQTFDWEDADGIREFIDRQWDMFKNGKQDHGEPDEPLQRREGEDISKYSRRSTARQMAALLDSVVK